MDAPLVFISHDHRDADIVKQFKELLTDVSKRKLCVFASSDGGIEYGRPTYPVIREKIDAATYVVALLTKRSIDRPWILFELGLAKARAGLDNRVVAIPLGVAVEDLKGPFAQWQNPEGNEAEVTKLVMQLVRRVPELVPSEDRVREQVRGFLGTVDDLLRTRSLEEQALGESDLRILRDDTTLSIDEVDDGVRFRVSRTFDAECVTEGLFHCKLPLPDGAWEPGECEIVIPDSDTDECRSAFQCSADNKSIHLEPPLLLRKTDRFTCTLSSAETFHMSRGIYLLSYGAHRLSSRFTWFQECPRRFEVFYFSDKLDLRVVDAGESARIAPTNGITYVVRWKKRSRTR